MGCCVQIGTAETPAGLIDEPEGEPPGSARAYVALEKIDPWGGRHAGRKVQLAKRLQREGGLPVVWLAVALN